MKQRIPVILLLGAFILMMACTPAALQSDKSDRLSRIAEGEGWSKTTSKEVADQISALDSSLQGQLAPALPDTTVTRDSVQAAIDVVRAAVTDGDSLVRPASPTTVLREAAAKVKRDTTTMDSLELAIYKHNKAIDDSLALDSINRSRKSGIDSPVEYSANDSLTYSAAISQARLYGSSKVKYQNMDLASEKIFMSLDSNIVHAEGRLDSTTQQTIGSPVFKMGSDEYQTGPMSFNFKSKKGLIADVYTQQDDGYLTSELSKRGSEGEMYLQHGRYTTCDDPHPDFYLAMSRAKVRPGKDVVFGPTYLVVADVPLPLAIPYGFFPFTKSYSSGLIMPTYGDETEKGFYLRDGGYYFAVSDKMDLKLLGEIYTKGSWGVTATSNYRKRYRFNGNFLVSYQNSIRGEKNMPDYMKTTDFKLTWNHTQDTKANPFRSFNARVNFATTSYDTNNLTSMYNPQTRTQSTRTSGVGFNTGFSSLGMTINSSFNLSQNMRDSTLNVELPTVSISVSQFYPFKRKKAAGAERWYEKISLSYTGNLKNQINNVKEDRILHTNLSRDWQNGMQHTIPIKATFTALGYLNIVPSINFTDRTLFRRAEKHWDTQNQKEVTDTVTGFYNVYDWSLSMNVNTKLYGFYVPSRKLFGDKIDRIRHVLTPSVSFNYAPDFGEERYGYYKTYQKTDANGNVSLVEYSPYDINIYRAPGKGKKGQISLDLKNNLEMKVKSDDDSTGYKKISLIDELGLNMSYNLATDIRPLSDLRTNLRLKLTKSYTLNIAANFASYVYEADSVGATPRVSEHTTYWGLGKWGRWQGISQNLSYSLNNDKVIKLFKRLTGQKVDDDKDKKKRKQDDDDDWDSVDSNVDLEMEKAKHPTGERSKAETDEDGYMKFKMPWNLNLGYTVSVSENRDNKRFNYNTMRYPYQIVQTLNVSGNVQLSDGWNINFNTGYDFETKSISMTRMSLSRDLHCFSMSCDVMLAPYTSYNFSFRCNASTLTDALKYDKRSGSTNAVQWY
ncbi:MAG: LPS-assembly protein LptD [Prevotella sp.]|nr:LPS-assembly protein LptD [Prevotella sp.]